MVSHTNQSFKSFKLTVARRAAHTGGLIARAQKSTSQNVSFDENTAPRKTWEKSYAKETNQTMFRTIKAATLVAALLLFQGAHAASLEIKLETKGLAEDILPKLNPSGTYYVTQNMLDLRYECDQNEGWMLQIRPARADIYGHNEMQIVLRKFKDNTTVKNLKEKLTWDTSKPKPTKIHFSTMIFFEKAPDGKWSCPYTELSLEVTELPHDVVDPNVQVDDRSYYIKNTLALFENILPNKYIPVEQSFLAFNLEIEGIDNVNTRFYLSETENPTGCYIFKYWETPQEQTKVEFRCKAKPGWSFCGTWSNGNVKDVVLMADVTKTVSHKILRDTFLKKKKSRLIQFKETRGRKAGFGGVWAWNLQNSKSPKRGLTMSLTVEVDPPEDA